MDKSPFGDPINQAKIDRSARRRTTGEVAKKPVTRVKQGDRREALMKSVENIRSGQSSRKSTAGQPSTTRPGSASSYLPSTRTRRTISDVRNPKS